MKKVVILVAMLISLVSVAYAEEDEDDGFILFGCKYKRLNPNQNIYEIEYVLPDAKPYYEYLNLPDTKPFIIEEKEPTVIQMTEISIPSPTPSPTPIPTATPTQIPKPTYNLNGKMGDMGRFCILDVGVDVALTSEATQENCDKPDLAYYDWYGKEWMYEHSYQLIGDHCYQGFDKIANCKVGTIAEIYNKDGVYRRYKCEKIFPGLINNGFNFVFNDGKILEEMYNGPDVLFVYTCYPKHPKVIVLLFREI